MREFLEETRTSAPDGMSQALEDYLAAVETGKAPPREEFIARHPELAEELDACLSALRFIGHAAQGPLSILADIAGPLSSPHQLGILGDFRIVREIGRGGMGVVYEAEQISLGRRVALKVLPFAAVADPRQLQRFRNEALAAASLDHPHVVKVHAVGCERGVHYIAMQFIDGRSLAEFIRERREGSAAASPPPTATEALDATRTLAPDATDPALRDERFEVASLPTTRPAADSPYVKRVAEWGVQAAEALEHAHSLGIVHRDVKPGNLLIDGRGELFVADFGLAKLVSDPGMTGTGDLLGTLRYMSPEQANAKHDLVDHRSDVFSLGVTLYELLTLAPAFDGADHQEILSKLISAGPVLPRKWDRGIPHDLETVILKAMEKDSTGRYSSAGALADDLRRFLADEPVQGRRPGLTERFARVLRRHPRTAAIAALAMAVLVVLSTAVSHQSYARLESERSAGEAALAAVNAELALAEAEASRAGMERLAAAREVFALANIAHRRAIDRPVGWTRANLDDLHKAATLAADDPLATTQLRSEAVTTLLAADLREAEPVADGFNAYIAAASPSGRLVALGEHQALFLLPRRVLLIDPITGQTKRVLRVPAGLAYYKPGQLGSDGVRSLAFAPDGKRLFVGTRESKVYRFDLDRPDDTPAAGWKAFSTTLENLAVSSDGRSVYGMNDRTLLRWDAETGAVLACLESSATALAAGGGQHFTVVPGTGEVLLPGGDGKVYRLDRDRFDPGNRTRSDTDHFQCVATLPGGRVLVAATVGRLGLFDPDPAADYRRTDVLVDPRLRGVAHARFISVIAPSPDGAYMATEAARQVKVWEIGSGRVIGSFTVGGTAPLSLAWSPDGRCLFATGPNRTLRWELLTPAAVRLTAPHAEGVAAAALFSDGRVVTVAGPGARDGITTSWYVAVEVPGGEASRVELVPSPDGNNQVEVAGAPFSGTIALTRKSGSLVVWSSGNPVCEPKAGAPDERSPRYSPTGAALWTVLRSDTVRVRDAATEKVRAEWTNAETSGDPGLRTLETLAVGNTVAVAASRGGTVIVLNGNAEPLRRFTGLADPVMSVALACDEALAVAGTQSGRVRVFSLNGGEERVLAAAHPGGVLATAFDRTGTYLATGGRDQSVKLWRRHGEQFELLFEATGLSGPVGTLEFARDADRLLVRVIGEHVVRVWDLQVLREQLAKACLSW